MCCTEQGQGCHLKYSVLAESIIALREECTHTSCVDMTQVSWIAGLDTAAEEALGSEGSGQDPGWADYGLGQATVMDGVRLIAGGIEVVLQRLQLQVSLHVFQP